jgi:hypothetical protein
MLNVREFTRTWTLHYVQSCLPDLPNEPSEIPAWTVHVTP